MNRTANREASSGESNSGSSTSLLDRVRAHDPMAWRELVQLYGPLITYWCRKAGLQPADVADVTQAVFMAVSRKLPDFRNVIPSAPANDEALANSGRENNSSRRNDFANPQQTGPTTSTPNRSGLFRSWLSVVTHRKLIDWRRAARPDQAQGGSSAAQRMLEHADPLDQSFQCSPDSTSNGIPGGESSWNAECQADAKLSRVWDGVVSRGLEQIRCEFQPQTWTAFWRAVVDGLSTAAVAAELGLSPASVRQAKSRILRRLRQQLGDL